MFKMVCSNLFSFIVCSVLISSSLSATRIIKESHMNARLKRVSPENTVVYGSRTQDRRDSSADSQQFLPAFGPLFGQLGHHSRPPRLYQEADYLPELTPFLQTAAASNQENAMLGSGNFGVIPGGTYYAAGETASASDPYLYDGNSHGRPHRYVQGHRINGNRFSGNPRPSAFRDPDDFFAGSETLLISQLRPSHHSHNTIWYMLRWRIYRRVKKR
uniref:ACYPI008745 protein n=1 Tax=Acyrthosiphon pisum TaxID=7029 RepID=C4WVE3_ACYPI|nr:ACYPI008745 [Acyrthosiphon pisum]